MNHTLRQHRALRLASRPARRLTPEGRFWSLYVVAFLLGMYALTELVTRAFA